MTTIFTRSLFAVSILLAGAATTGVAQAGNADDQRRLYCESIIRASVDGAGHITRADADHCAQIGIYVSGYGHETDVTGDDGSRTSVSQLGEDTSVTSTTEGVESDTGIVAADGARVDYESSGFNADGAIYAKGGDIRVRSRCNDCQVVVKTN